MISLIVQFTKSFDFAVLYPMIDHGFYDGGYKGTILIFLAEKLTS